MTLDPVSTGDPHVAAHNAERAAINSLLAGGGGGGGTGIPSVALARDPDTLISGTITRDVNGAATSAPVTWPDGTTGLYTADVVSSVFPGFVDAYHITYEAATVISTYTQPQVTRDSAGRITILPAIVVT